MTDFFISYTHADRPWAEWIAWVLEEAGYTTKIQAWEFRRATNLVIEMQKAPTSPKRTGLHAACGAAEPFTRLTANAASPVSPA